ETFSFKTNYSFTGEKYLGKFLNKVIEGTAEGNRDVWLTSVIGTMLNQGVDAQNAYVMADVINQNFINPPLNDDQVNKIYLSILDKEARKRGVAV
ncbi:MAG: primase alpha helix C-terminal domain-containing protein, partial [Staphylococcus equorum]|nr:primase alpha helix C-terminal domain-containing protein [Staphylococcus equorum]